MIIHSGRVDVLATHGKPLQPADASKPQFLRCCEESLLARSRNSYDKASQDRDPASKIVNSLSTHLGDELIRIRYLPDSSLSLGKLVVKDINILIFREEVHLVRTVEPRPSSVVPQAHLAG